MTSSRANVWCFASFLLLSSFVVGSCSKQSPSDGAEPVEAAGGSAYGGSPQVTTPAGGSPSIVISLGDASTDNTSDAGSVVSVWPPAGYINVTDTTIGAYALGPDISDGQVKLPGVCAGLFGVMRDFKMGSQTGGHPDFETAQTRDVKGIVENALGADGKPVYASGTASGTSGRANFDQWYRDTPDVNKTFIVGLKLVASNGISTFSASKGNGAGTTDSSFFPLDGQGWGNEGQPHNFSFTTEIRTAFKYLGGETFTFKGDDDVWVFIDKKLVIDLGGRHAQETGTVSVDTLGLTVGQEYDLAVFHAERHTSESNFQIQTTLAFTNCGQIGTTSVLL